MPDVTSDHGSRDAYTRPAARLESPESAKYFEAERLEESRKRFASYSLWAGLFSLLLLLIPNPAPWLFGPVATLLGVHALVRILLQPTRHAGVLRASIGIALGIIAMVVSSYL